MQARPSIYTNGGIRIQEQYIYRSPYVFTLPTVIVRGWDIGRVEFFFHNRKLGEGVVINELERIRTILDKSER